MSLQWRNNQINVAVQVLPLQGGILKYSLVDAVIQAIDLAGYRYKVCPFETVVECSYAELGNLLETIHESSRSAGTDMMLTNLKIQVDFHKDTTIEDKMEKYS